VSKRQFLAPLSVCIVALLNGAPVRAEVSTLPTGTPVVMSPETPAPAGMVQLVLTRSAGSSLHLTDHESHASHESHESHASHSSHMSGS
jgi:hypothetical protein